MVCFLLAGCRQDSMIKFSAENQARIEEKKKENQSGESLEESTKQMVSQNESTDLSEETDPVASDQLEMIPKEDWVPAERGTSYDIWAYAPYLSNQLKTFANPTMMSTTYSTFAAEDYRLTQVQRRMPNLNQQYIYEINDGVITEYPLEQSGLYVNYLENFDRTYYESGTIILASPLEVGNKWQAKEGQEREITQLYESIYLDAGEISYVVEVSYYNENQYIKEYYAQNQGLVARWISKAPDQSGIFTQLQSDYRNVMLVYPEIVYTPDDMEGNDLKQEKVEFVWQTNGLIGRVFTDMLRFAGLIDDTVQVNDVFIDSSNVAVIDFTPGLVSVLNQKDAPEQMVIQAIVETVAHFTDCQQVRLTVNGNGLLPNTIEYPTDGIYKALYTQE